MARLKAEVKTFIVQRLACFDTPSTVAEAVSENFGITMTRMAVEKYDPTKVAGRELGKKLRAVFEETREHFLKDTSTIAVSHKAVRLQRLERMADKAETMKNYALAAQLLEQVAKEMGDHYTNLRKIAPTDPEGKKPYEGMSRDQIDARITELYGKLEKEGAL